MIKAIFDIALKSLIQHRRRSMVQGGAIALVTALMVIMLGLSEGMNRTLIEASTTLMSGHVNVAGFFKPTAGQAAPVVTHVPKLLELVHKEVPELKYVAQRGRGWAKVISDTSSKMMGVTGIDVKQEVGLKEVLVLREGNFDALAKPNTMLIFDDQAADLEVKVGDQVTISAPTPRGTNNTVDVTIVAIAKSMGLMSSFASFMNAETLRQLYQLNEDTTGALQVYLPTADMVVVKKIEERLRTALEKAGYKVMEDDPRAFFFKFENVTREAWTGQKLDVTSWRDEVSFVSWTVDLMNAMAFIVAFLLLAIVGVGIMNVMWIAIRERTREIGTLRAIGMQWPHVLWMFVVEGFLLAAFSTTFGALAGAGISAAINSAAVPLPLSVQLVVMSDHLIIIPTLQWALIAIGFITLIVTLISVIPAGLAARLKPITAMSHAG